MPPSRCGLHHPCPGMVRGPGCRAPCAVPGQLTVGCAPTVPDVRRTLVRGERLAVTASLDGHCTASTALHAPPGRADDGWLLWRSACSTVTHVRARRFVGVTAVVATGGHARSGHTGWRAGVFIRLAGLPASSTRPHLISCARATRPEASGLTRGQHHPGAESPDVRSRVRMRLGTSAEPSPTTQQRARPWIRAARRPPRAPDPGVPSARCRRRGSRARASASAGRRRRPAAAGP